MYQGSCHCGKVRFSFDQKPTKYTDCDCSVCIQKGSKHHLLEEGAFRLLSPSSHLSLYQFGTMAAKHYFCSNCGIHTHCNSRVFPNRIAVNLNCVPDVDLSSVERFYYNGASD